MSYLLRECLIACLVRTYKTFQENIYAFTVVVQRKAWESCYFYAVIIC